MLDSALKVSVILAAALLATRLLRSQSAALRHLVLATAVCSAVMVPAVESVVPAWNVPFSRLLRLEPEPQITVAFTASPASSVAVAGVLRVADSGEPRQTASRGPARATGIWLFRLWMVGAASSLLMLLAGLGRLAWLASTAQPLESARWHAAAEALALECGLRRPIRLLVSGRRTLLVTWGHRRPIVLVPASAASWPADRVRVVLSHELAHIQRRDWLTLMTAEVLRALHWFNPIVWVACRRLRVEAEQACDDAVLRRGVEGPAYASHLLDIARSFGRHRRLSVPAPAMVRATSLERRVGAMLNPRLNRRPTTAAARITTIGVASVLTASIAGFGVAAQTFGSVSGSVVDATNRPVSGTTLVVTGAPNQAKQELRSDASGHFGGIL